MGNDAIRARVDLKPNVAPRDRGMLRVDVSAVKLFDRQPRGQFPSFLAFRLADRSRLDIQLRPIKPMQQAVNSSPGQYPRNLHNQSR